MAIVEAMTLKNHLVYIKEGKQNGEKGFFLHIKIFYRIGSFQDMKVAFSTDKDKLEAMMPLLEAPLAFISTQSEQPEY